MHVDRPFRSSLSNSFQVIKKSPFTRKMRVRSSLVSGIFGALVCCGLASRGDEPSPQPAQTGDSGATKVAGGEQAAASGAAKSEEAKLLETVREALERNAQELKALKEQYAKDMAEQKKTVEAQQKQIETLERSAQALQDRLKAPAAAPNAPGGQNVQGQDRQKQVADLQQKQIGLLEEQVQLVCRRARAADPCDRELAKPDGHARITRQASRTTRPGTRQCS